MPIKYIERARKKAKTKREKQKGKGRIRYPKGKYDSEPNPQRRLRPIRISKKLMAKLKPTMDRRWPELKSRQYELVTNQMLRERVSSPEIALPDLAVRNKRRRVRQQTLEEQPQTPVKTEQPQADLKAVPKQESIRKGHQYSLDEHHRRAKAPVPVIPTTRRRKSKRPGVSHTQQIVRQIRPRPPSRKH